MGRAKKSSTRVNFKLTENNARDKPQCPQPNEEKESHVKKKTRISYAANTINVHDGLVPVFKVLSQLERSRSIEENMLETFFINNVNITIDYYRYIGVEKDSSHLERLTAILKLDKEKKLGGPEVKALWHGAKLAMLDHKMKNLYDDAREHHMEKLVEDGRLTDHRVLAGYGVMAGEGVSVGEGISVGEGVSVCEGVSVGEGNGGRHHKRKRSDSPVAIGTYLERDESTEDEKEKNGEGDDGDESEDGDMMFSHANIKKSHVGRNKEMTYLVRR